MRQVKRKMIFRSGEDINTASLRGGYIPGTSQEVLFLTLVRDPGYTQATISSAENQTKFGHVQGKYLNPCAISLSL